MNPFIRNLFLLPACLLCACSSMNSHFSCNVTARDSCMSLDEVNAITEGKAIHLIPKEPYRPPVLMKTKVRRVWIAPFADSRGVTHQGEVVYVPELIKEAQA